MSRIELEKFSGKDILRIFIADSIELAELVEDILTQKGIDYAMSLEPFVQIFM
jgi:hypothetical protein